MYRPGNDRAVTAAGNLLIAEASVPAAVEWLCNPVLPEFLALLVPPNMANSRQPSPLGGMQKRISFAADLADDTKLDESCKRAYNTVVEFELAQMLQPANMSCDYLADRESCISAAFKLAEQFELSDEVVFDAVLMMDRVMSTGAQHESNLSMLFVAASLRVSCPFLMQHCSACAAAHLLQTCSWRVWPCRLHGLHRLAGCMNYWSADLMFGLCNPHHTHTIQAISRCSDVLVLPCHRSLPCKQSLLVIRQLQISCQATASLLLQLASLKAV